MNNEENDRDADTGIGHVECGPRMCERDVQIEQEKIDDVSIEETISQISEHAREQQGEGKIAPKVPRPPKRSRAIRVAAVAPPQQQHEREQKGDA